MFVCVHAYVCVYVFVCVCDSVVLCEVGGCGAGSIVNNFFRKAWEMVAGFYCASVGLDNLKCFCFCCWFNVITTNNII